MKKERVLQFVAVACSSINDKALLKRTLIDFLKGEYPDDISVEKLVGAMELDHKKDVNIATHGPRHAFPYVMLTNDEIDTLLKAGNTLVEKEKSRDNSNVQHYKTSMILGRLPQKEVINELLIQLDRTDGPYFLLGGGMAITKEYFRKQLNDLKKKHEVVNGAAGNTQATPSQNATQGKPYSMGFSFNVDNPLAKPLLMPFYDALKLLHMGNKIARISWPEGSYWTTTGGPDPKITAHPVSMPGGGMVQTITPALLMATDWFIVK